MSPRPTRGAVLGAALLLVAAPTLALEPGGLRQEAEGIAAELRGIRLAQAQDPTLRTAALEIRIARIEEQLRQLTGRIEEAEYAQRQTAARIDRLIADLDARLPGQPPLAGPTSPAPAPEQQAALPEPEPPPREVPPSILAPAQPERPDTVLGTIPQSVAPRPAAPAPVPDGPDASYRQALDLLQSGHWVQAEQAFNRFIETYPEDSRTPTASYWLGETYLFRKDYQTAASTFARNYRTYGQDAPRAPDNLLKLGIALAAMGDRDRACQTFGELEKRHPRAPAPIQQALGREKIAAGCG